MRTNRLLVWFVDWSLHVPLHRIVDNDCCRWLPIVIIVCMLQLLTLSTMQNLVRQMHRTIAFKLNPSTPSCIAANIVQANGMLIVTVTSCHAQSAWLPYKQYQTFYAMGSQHASAHITPDSAWHANVLQVTGLQSSYRCTNRFRVRLLQYKYQAGSWGQRDSAL